MTERPAQRILDRLDAVKEQDGGWMARCPAHDDNRPSLSVGEGDDGRALLRCFAGCKNADIVAALGLKMGDLFAGKPRHAVAFGKPSPAAFYVYEDADGPRYKIRRTASKQFYPYVFDRGRGRYKNSAGWFGVEPIPYRLPELLASSGTVYWVEGEKDADTLAGLGLTATTSPGGTNSYKPGFAEHLKGRDVVVVADNDEPGRKYARQVARSALGLANSVKVLELPGLDEGGDASDFVAAGGTKAAFLAHAAKAPDFKPRDEPDQGTFTQDDEGSPGGSPLELLSLGTDAEIPEQEYLVDGLIPAAQPSMTYGDGGVGKSILCLSMACALAAGMPDWLGFALKQTNVVYLDYEMPFEEQVRRARKIARGLGLEGVPEGLYYLMGSPEHGWEAIKDACIGARVGLLVVDSFGVALAGDMEASNDIIAFVREFVKPLLNHGIAVHFVDHQPKAQGANYQDMTAFGSVYKRNLVRSQLQVEGFQDDEEANLYRIVFRHKKHNFGPKLPPFGAELVFADEETRIRPVTIDAEIMMKEKDLKVEDRVLLALYEEGGALTRADIAERIASSAGTVANALTGLRKRDLATESMEKEGRQSKYELMQKGRTRVEFELTGVPSENGWKDGGAGLIG